MSFPQPDLPCLRFPENLGLHANITIEAAANMLLRALQLSQTVPYAWTFIDKPVEGQLLLLYLQNPTQFPNDGIRYQDQETRYVVPVNNREMEIAEVKYGFVPNSQDQTAWRVRRRYRLHKGGLPQLVLVHYTRGPAIHETETISTRTLAITRYRRNHELMEEVFKQAAFGNMKRSAPPSLHQMFDKSELESKVAKLQEEVDVLQTKADERKAKPFGHESIMAASAQSPMEITS
ncbi:hypothetical protein ID866_6160 [Astraeus odoratus]|nr:hypothetical protein ID866_6160 [Astraeus odoratus]